MNRLACAVSGWTVLLFADARTVLLLVVLSTVSGVWAAAARSELAATLFLSILALAITSAILYVGEQREAVSSRRDEAMHRKLDTLIRGVPDADDAVAGIER